MRKEFERVSPESVGIPSGSIEKLIDKLEEGWTEPHGLMIMRDGKVCAEGWWTPYAPGIRHGLQSHTKTYAATAVGIAYTEGLVDLEERVIDIFPDEAPKDPSENLKKLKVKHVLAMACGMKTMPMGGMEWIKDFLATPVEDEPGTSFMYNSTGSSLLAAIVKKRSGQGMIEYLRTRLFDKIGIDTDNLKCICMPDGIEMGGGGMYATTEDNLRLMKLYADGGVWEGERILAEDYVKKATSLQNESATERAVNPPAEDNFVGYGYQIWMCRPEGVYRADGAMGQFTIVFPKYNMLLAITECAMGATGGEMPQKALDTIWEWYYSLPSPDTKLAEDKAVADHLARRMKMLALPSPDRSPVSPYQKDAEGKYVLTDGNLSFCGMGFFKPAAEGTLIKEVSLKFGSSDLFFDVVTKDGSKMNFTVALDGSYRENKVPDLVDQCLMYGKWTSDNTFVLTNRKIETCAADDYVLTFEGDKLTITQQTRFFGLHENKVEFKRA